ncbi:hypothetical protein ABPG74_020141 [Tetrahymena malaccensis]
MLSHLQQVQESYLKLCLQSFKPELEFKLFVQGTLKYSDDQDVFCHIVVFDLREQKNKLLIVFKSTLSKKYQFFQKVWESSFRNDLVLNILDQYYLDPNQHFYIFEMEYCDMKLQEFIKVYTLDKNIFEPLINEIYGFVNKKIGILLDYKKSNNQQKEIEGFGQQGNDKFIDFKLSKFYVNFSDQNKIEIKINLIDTDFYMIKHGQLCQNFEDTGFLKQDKQVSLIKEFEIENNLKQAEQKPNIFQEFVNIQKLSKMLKELCESVRIKIQKKDLTEIIKQKFLKILKYHPLEIFYVIQQHPLYDVFEIHKLDGNSFELKIEKRGQVIRLIANKFCQLSEAKKMLERHQLLINQKEDISTFIQSDLITIESYYYVVAEKIQIYYLDVILSGALDNIIFLSGTPLTFSEFLEYSCNLLIQKQISITNIDPSSIIIFSRKISQQQFEGQIDLFQQLSTQNEIFSIFKIDNLNEESDFSLLYQKIFLKYFDQLDYNYNYIEGFQYFKNDLCIQANLLIQKISEKSIQEVKSLKEEIQFRIQSIKSLKSKFESLSYIFKISKKNSQQIQANIREKPSSFYQTFNFLQQILDFQQNGEFFKITSLEIEQDYLDKQKQKYKVNDPFKDESCNQYDILQNEEKINQLNNFFSIYQSDAIKQYSTYFFQFLLIKKNNKIIEFEVCDPKSSSIKSENLRYKEWKSDQNRRQPKFSQNCLFNQIFDDRPVQLSSNYYQAQQDNINELFQPVQFQNFQPSCLNIIESSGFISEPNNLLFNQTNSLFKSKQTTFNQIYPLETPQIQTNNIQTLSILSNLPVEPNQSNQPIRYNQLINQFLNISEQNEQNQSQIFCQTQNPNQTINFAVQNTNQKINDTVQTVNLGFNINQIINLNELSQEEHNLITNYNNNLYYLIGQDPYIIFKHQEFQKIEDVLLCNHDLQLSLVKNQSDYDDCKIQLTQFYKIKRLVIIKKEYRLSDYNGNSDDTFNSERADDELKELLWDDQSF